MLLFTGTLCCFNGEKDYLCCREYVHSLTTTVNAFAAALCGMAGGFTIISFMDEMHALFQVILSLWPDSIWGCFNL